MTTTLFIPTDDLCLSFVNTRSWRGTAAPVDELGGISDVLVWAGQANAALAGGMQAWFAAHPREATSAFSAAIALREVLFTLFADTAEGKLAALSFLNAALDRAGPRLHLARQDADIGWRIENGPPCAERLLAPVLWSAADLLAGPRRGLVRKCANPQCGWLFIDDSKSGNRRWCSMSACGNRAKAQRHYMKRRKADA
jgi:predicted RNA-binding Zn ribbon-like protein